MVDFATQTAIVAFGANLFLTVYVLVKRKGLASTLNQSFSLLSLSFALWNLGLAMHSEFFFHFGILFLPPATYMFLLVLLGRSSMRARRQSLILWVISFLLITADILGRYYLRTSTVLDFFS